MSRSLELGRAVLCSPALTLELWLTTSITISLMQGRSDLQQLKSAELLKMLSSGDFWVCRAVGLHVRFHLTLRDELFPPPQLQIVTDTLLKAPVSLSAMEIIFVDRILDMGAAAPQIVTSWRGLS